MGPGDFLKLLRSVDRLLSLEEKHGKAIEGLAGEIESLRSRVIRLENREDIVVAEAKGAASAAASQVAIASTADMARRIGRLEERSDQRRLPPSQS